MAIPFGAKSEIQQSLHEIDHIPVAAVKGGDVVVQNDLIGLAPNDIAAGELGSLSVAGTALVAKGTENIPAGFKVYWDEDDQIVTTTGTSNVALGHTINDAGTAGSSALVLYGFGV